MATARDAFPPSGTLIKRRRSLAQRGYCTFARADWTDLGVNLNELASIALKHRYQTSLVAKWQGVNRSLILGQLTDGEVTFWSTGECPLRHSAILADYDETLLYSDAVRRLVKAAVDLAPAEVRNTPTARFCLEVISNRRSAVTELPAHRDEVSLLLFLVLHNTMIGGALKLYRHEQQSKAVRRLSCVAGTGYAILERVGNRDYGVLHGCGGWTSSPGTAAERRTIRLTVHTKNGA